MRVINVRREQCTHYVGRMTSWAGNGMPTQLGNPFPVGICGRQQAIDKFEAYARNSPEILARINALPEDAVLGCWCAPMPCHANVIAKLWKEMHGQS